MDRSKDPPLSETARTIAEFAAIVDAHHPGKGTFTAATPAEHRHYDAARRRAAATSTAPPPATASVQARPAQTARPRGAGRPAARRTASSSSGDSSDPDDPAPGEPALPRPTARHRVVAEGWARARHADLDRALDDALDDDRPVRGPGFHRHTIALFPRGQW
jgi:hypothetical protein